MEKVRKSGWGGLGKPGGFVYKPQRSRITPGPPPFSPLFTKKKIEIINSTTWLSPLLLNLHVIYYYYYYYFFKFWGVGEPKKREKKSLFEGVFLKSREKIIKKNLKKNIFILVFLILGEETGRRARDWINYWQFFFFLILLFSIFIYLIFLLLTYARKNKKIKKFQKFFFKKKGQDYRRFFEKAGKNRRTNGRNKILSKRYYVVSYFIKNSKN